MTRVLVSQLGSGNCSDSTYDTCIYNCITGGPGGGDRGDIEHQLPARGTAALLRPGGAQLI